MQNKDTANYSNDGTVEIDLLEILGVLMHWLWLIALVGIVCGAVVFCYSKFVLPEQFQSSTKIYVLNRSDSSNDMPTSQDLQVGSQLSQDYAQLITSRHVLENVINGLDLPGSYEGLKGQISVSRPNDSRIIQITVTNTDPGQAQVICRAVREEASRHIKDVMDIDAINVVDDANLPTQKSAPNNVKNALIGVLVGAFIVAAVVVVRYMLDDSVKSREDVEEKLGISCLAMIPLDEAMSANEEKKSKRVRRFRRISLKRSKGKRQTAE